MCGADDRQTFAKNGPSRGNTVRASPGNYAFALRALRAPVTGELVPSVLREPLDSERTAE